MMHFERKRFFSCGAVVKLSILELFFVFNFFSLVFVYICSSISIFFSIKIFTNLFFFLIYSLCVLSFIYISKLFLIKILSFFFYSQGRSITNMYCQQVTKLISSIGRPLKLRFKKQPNPLLLSRPLRYAVAFQKGRIGLGLKEFKEITKSKQTSSFYGSNTSKSAKPIDNIIQFHILYYIQSFTFQNYFQHFFFAHYTTILQILTLFFVFYGVIL